MGEGSHAGQNGEASSGIDRRQERDIEAPCFLEAYVPVKKPGPGEAADPAVVALCRLGCVEVVQQAMVAASFENGHIECLPNTVTETTFALPMIPISLFHRSSSTGLRNRHIRGS